MPDRFGKQRQTVYPQVVLLAPAASVIYSAPYLRQLFRTPLLDARAFDELRRANLSATYAVFSIPCYRSGAWLYVNYATATACPLFYANIAGAALIAAWLLRCMTQAATS